MLYMFCMFSSLNTAKKNFLIEMKQSLKEKSISRHPFHEAGLKTQHDYHKLLLLTVRYGFRSPPHLELKARPKLGEREVTLVHITEWIEKKLDQEFQVYTERNKHGEI